MSRIVIATLVIALSDSPCVRIGNWETCPILKHQRRGTNIGRKPTLTEIDRSSSCIEKDCFENNRTTAAQMTAELNVKKKLSDASLTIPTLSAELQVLIL
jgi:hypothetical protein